MIAAISYVPAIDDAATMNYDITPTVQEPQLAQAKRGLEPRVILEQQTKNDLHRLDFTNLLPVY